MSFISSVGSVAQLWPSPAQPISITSDSIARYHRSRRHRRSRFLPTHSSGHRRAAGGGGDESKVSALSLL